MMTKREGENGIDCIFIERSIRAVNDSIRPPLGRSGALFDAQFSDYKRIERIEVGSGVRNRVFALIFPPDGDVKTTAQQSLHLNISEASGLAPVAQSQDEQQARPPQSQTNARTGRCWQSRVRVTLKALNQAGHSGGWRRALTSHPSFSLEVG